MTDPLAHVPAAIRTSLERLDVPQVVDEDLIGEVLAGVTKVPWTGESDAYAKAVAAVVTSIVVPAMRAEIDAEQASLTRTLALIKQLEDKEAFQKMQTDDWIH